MNNHNNWGSQPPGQAYNGLPSMPIQQGYQQQQQQPQQQQQQYGNGNVMAYVGNQQYQANGQFLSSNHQMQPMPQYLQQQPLAHTQPQSINAHHFHAPPHHQQPHQQQPHQHQHQQPHQHQHQQPHQHQQHQQQQHQHQLQHQQHQQHQQLQQHQLQQQQMQLPQYNNGTYGHAAPMPPAQYMTQPNYSQQHQSFHQPQQVATPSPRQMQRPLPSPRPQNMPRAQPPPQQLQPVSRPPTRPPQPSPYQDVQHMPSPQTQNRAPTSMDTSQLQQNRSYVQSPQVQQRAPASFAPRQSQSHMASPQMQQAAPNYINRNQAPQSHDHAASPQAKRRAVEPMSSSRAQQRQHHVQSPQMQQHVPNSANPSQIYQSQTRAPSVQLQHHDSETVPPSHLQQGQTHAPSPQPQSRAPESLKPSQLQHKDQTHMSSPRLQHHMPESLNPSQLHQSQPPPPPQPQHHASDSIDPSRLLQSPPPVASLQSQPPVPDSIDPSQLLQAQPHASPTQLQRTMPDAIDPSKLHHGQHPGAVSQPERSLEDVIDPSQLMLQTQPQARKSISSGTSTTKSPSTSHAHSPSQHFDTPAVLTCVANDCFRAAHAAVYDVAASLHPKTLDEYYKLIATGLGCLEAALALNKLPPRAEANVRLRYATILSEETDNLREAEVALTKGIVVCEKSRLTDLKYCMQFQLLKVLFRRNRKAALVALDKNISEATTYKAVDWVYAYRFLRASFHLQSGSPPDTHAMENLRNIASLATHRGDLAIAVLTFLLEGIIHLNSRKEDSIVRVQHCIAQAARYQLDPSVHIPQIEVLTLLLDLACSLQQKAPQVAMQKLKSLQIRMDELVQTSDWDTFRNELLLPLKRQPNSSTSVTEDTKTIIRPGAENNFIVMSFVTKVHAFVLAYVLSGLALLYHGARNEKIMEYWMEALNMLSKSSEQIRPAAYSLPMAIEQAKWRAEVGCYIDTLIALVFATRTAWRRVHECIQRIDALKPKPEDGRLGLLVLYVKGVYHQGTGNLDQAYKIFSDPRFDIAAASDTQASGVGANPPEISLLAALNKIWIMQEPSRRDVAQTTDLLEAVRPYCADHADIDIRTAFNLVAAAIETHPPQSMQTVKRHISTGLKFAQAANNTQLLGVALNLMRSCLFDSVVGEQAVKSAKAGRAQAQKAGNLLWMSVGEGMLAQTEEMQGQVAEAQQLRASGTVHANEAFVNPGAV